MAKLKYMKNIVCALIFLLIANNGYTQVNPDSLKLIWTNNTLSDSLRFKAQGAGGETPQSANENDNMPNVAPPNVGACERGTNVEATDCLLYTSPSPRD